MGSPEIRNSHRAIARVYPRSLVPRDNPPIILGGSHALVANHLLRNRRAHRHLRRHGDSIVVFGDTRRNRGQRAVAEKFAQIALTGAVAIVSLPALP